MKIKEMYDTPRYPYHYMVECMDGSTKLFYMTPFRKIVEKDLMLCTATAKQVGGRPVEPYLLKTYGLQKGEE